jgi:hypothetical protein
MNFGQLLLEASDDQLDDSMKKLIRKWSNPPTAIQVLEVLDKCIHASLASGFVITSLQIIYEAACKQENKTHEEVVKHANWRR